MSLDDHASARIQFGVALRRVMTERGISEIQLAKAIGSSISSVHQWCHGRHLPKLRSGNRLAAALVDSDLLALLIRLRTRDCEVCGTPIIDAGDTRRRFCNQICLRLAHKGVTVKRRPDPRQLAITAFCQGCEPEGACRDDTCVLRAFSPLPFVPMEAIRVARRPAWSAERRAKASARAKAYWSNTEVRARQAALTAAALATPEARARMSRGGRRARSEQRARRAS